MYQASCLCGQVKILIDGTITDIIHCHCSRCRKSTGTAFATNGYVSKEALTLLQGTQTLNFYQASKHTRKYFCSNCASPIYSENSQDPLRVRLRLGVLDSDIIERPNSHNFVTSRACWDQFDDHLPHYKGCEPNRSKS